MRELHRSVAEHGRLVMAALPRDAERRLDVHLAFAGSGAGRARFDLRMAPDDGPSYAGSFEVRAPFDVEAPATHDGALLLALWPGLLRGGHVHVHGPVSRALLRNMHDLQAIWVGARPDVARPFALTADAILDEVPRAPEDLALLPLTGGADSMLSLCQHTDPARPLGEATLQVGAALFIPGYSPRIDRREEFPAAIAAVEGLAATRELPLVVVETDWMERCPQAAFMFGTLLAAIPTLLARHFRHALIGSSLPFAWRGHRHGGSAAEIDRFMSSGGLEVHSDVNDLHRGEKLKALEGYPGMLDRLQVCFETHGLTANCCRCAKCTRTMLQMLSQGMEIPAQAFPQGISRHHIGKRMQSPGHLSYAGEVLEHARALGVRHPDLDLLRRRYRVRRLKYLVRHALTRWVPGLNPLEGIGSPPRWLIERRVRAQARRGGA